VTRIAQGTPATDTTSMLLGQHEANDALISVCTTAVVTFHAQRAKIA